MVHGHQTECALYFRNFVAIMEEESDFSLDDTKFLLNMYICLGAALEEIGLKDMAMGYYTKGIDLAKTGLFDSQRAMLINNIGVVYVEIDDAEHAMKYFKNALEINLKLDNAREIFINYSNIADLEAKAGNYGKAIDSLLKALQYVDGSDSNSYYATQVCLGELYLRQKDYPMAHSYLDNSLHNLQKLHYVPALIQGYATLSDLFAAQHSLDSAAIYNQKALLLAQEVNNKFTECSLIKQKADIQSKLGNSSLAYSLVATAAAMQASLAKADSRQRLQQSQIIYAAASDFSGKNSTGKAWILAAAFAAACIAIVLGVIIAYRRKKAQLDALMQPEQETHLQENRQHITSILEKAEMAQAMETIGNDLKTVLLELNPRSTAQKSRIRQILNRLSTFNNQSNLDECQYYFDKTDPDFLKKLEEKFPELTIKDKRLCAMLYLMMSTKEIASVTSLEIRSVESARIRLRKKMNVPPATSLSDFLRSL